MTPDTSNNLFADRQLRMLHISRDASARCLASVAFVDDLRSLGELTIVTGAHDWTPTQIAQAVRSCEVYLAGWGSVMLPASLAGDPGDLRYICGLTGSMREFVPIELVEVGIPLTNWGDAPAQGVAEGAFALLIASIKALPFHGRSVRDGGWGVEARHRRTLDGLRVGVYGMGVIGRRFVEMLRPFGAVVSAYDPYAGDLPDGVRRVESLLALAGDCDAFVIHVGLTDETRGSVSRELLARLPDGAVVVNTARGGIVDQAALFDEVSRGRLRAALDVLDPDRAIPPGHPLRDHPGVMFTAHQISNDAGQPHPPRLARREISALENLRRYRSGEPPLFRLDPHRYRLST